MDCRISVGDKMKNKYEHISKMEDIMVKQEKDIKDLTDILNKIKNSDKEYKKLFDYYYSEQREKDLEDEEKHLIPENINRGVLSEDEVYNLILDTHDTALEMIEVALDLLKKY